MSKTFIVINILRVHYYNLKINILKVIFIHSSKDVLYEIKYVNVH